MSDFIKVHWDFYSRGEAITCIRLKPMPDVPPAYEIYVYLEKCGQPEIFSFGTEEDARKAFDNLKEWLGIFN